MKILLTTLNSKFIHSSLAIRYLAAYCADKPYNIKSREFTINDSLETVTAEIFSEGADITAFSCYIWNIEETLRIVRRLKRIKKEMLIVLGGPEVSFESRELLEKHPFIDFIVRGEGEVTFRQLMEHLVEGTGKLEEINGITYRIEEGVAETPDRELIQDLDTIPFPYDGNEDLANKIIYYEASRGCPFQCQYCLSSTIKGVRYFSLKKVKADLEKLIALGVKQVKFVDRTFNSNRDFAREIFSFLIGKGGDTNFHFEISADLLDGQLMEMLKTAPPGLFQFEVGVQTTNPVVLKEIRRQTSLTRLFGNVKTIKGYGNVHQHLDLIAGLPMEDMSSFAASFDDVFRAGPDMLQLGFLKLLKGSGLRGRAKECGYVYTEEPPYEVLHSMWMGYEELLRLKLIEEVLEYYYNSHRFDNTLEYVLGQYYPSPFGFFYDLSEYWRDRGLHLVRHSSRELYTLLYQYLMQAAGMEALMANELLKLDFLLREKALVLPPPLMKTEIPSYRQRCLDFIDSPENMQRYLRSYSNLSPKQILKLVHFEAFDPCILKHIGGIGEGAAKGNVILFDYRNRDKIRGKSRINLVEI